MSQHTKGSSYQLLQFTRTERKVVAHRLTKLINLPEVKIDVSDSWRPDGDKHPLEVITETVPEMILSKEHKSKISSWWLKHPQKANTPNWDFISSTSIEGEKGLLIIEAKSHWGEVTFAGKKPPNKGSIRGRENHNKIAQATKQADIGLKEINAGISIDIRSHYQLSNRLAFSWKLASLGIPVVLVYLGFLKDTTMASKNNHLFQSHDDWKDCIFRYTNGVFPENLLEKKIKVGPSSFRFLIRSMDVPL